MCFNFECTIDGEQACPNDGVCIDTEDGTVEGYCFKACDSDADCRDNYVCRSWGVGGAGACAPGCNDDSDCSDGRECDPGGSCRLPLVADEIGAACAPDHGCTSGYCISEQYQQWPSGYCIRTCASDADCGAKGACILYDERTPEGSCLATCETDEDCRPGYKCEEDGPEDTLVCLPGCTADTDCEVIGNVCNTHTGICEPAYNPDDFGGECWDDANCEGGMCYTEANSGNPRGLCTSTGCTVGEPCEGGAGICLDVSMDDGTGVCFPACETDDDCRDGYECQNDGPGGAGICWGNCTGDFDCWFGNVCNPMGNCVEAFDETEIGDACWTDEDCRGGACYEDRNGFPSGMCVMPGCNVAENDCPGDAVCVEDGYPDGIGICYDGCAAAADCRAGYGCVAAPAGGRVCMPDCTADAQCGPVTCNTDSGYCNDEEGELGDPCATAADCGTLTDAVCLTAGGHTGGYCTQACDTAMPSTSCEEGTCLPGGHCYAGCLTTLDCREGYTCQYVEGVGGGTYCLPPA
jgi:hypothetical protein